MTLSNPDRPYQHMVDAGLEVARSALTRSYHLTAAPDPQLIRLALKRLPPTGRIDRLRDLAALRWIAILLEHLPENHPDRGELHHGWAIAMGRACE